MKEETRERGTHRRGVLRATGGLAAAIAAATSGGALAACGAPAKEAIGTATRPLKMAFVPSSDSQKVLSSGKPIGELLEKETSYNVGVSVPTSYVAVVEAMGSNQIDVGWLAPFSYAVAHKRYGVDVILSTVRSGSKSYPWQLIVHADSGIRKPEDLKGKRFAFGDPLSTSSYLYPAAYIKEKLNTDPEKFFSQIQFAGGHDKVVVAVYNKQVDGGATYGPSVGQPESDARSRVVSTLPDVMKQVVRILEADQIPNDTVSVRKGLPKDVMEKVKAGLLKIAASDEGKKHLKALYSIDGLSAASDADYAPLRKKSELLKLDLEVAAGIKPAPTATKGP
ncbi:MAG: phosphate/phosphite/phosphonate ABC transporter substrate-binding protein [Chloroflexi bacterium]|nr:phosphate/phosphite/phosphonate ABC transporter substrate-binding protein [Chloroflexota bacterium]